MSAEAGADGSASIIQRFRLEDKPEAEGLLLGPLKPEGPPETEEHGPALARPQPG